MGAGEAWKGRREAMGLTLEEAALALRVSRKYLQGIEEGDYAGWPERVFSSGFIRSYAKLLSEDPEPVLTEYYGHIERSAVDAAPGIIRPEWVERERQRGSRRFSYTVAAVVVLFLGMLLAWYASRMASAPAPAPAPARPVPAAAPTPAENAAVRPPADNVAVAPAPVAAPAPADNAAPPSPPAAQGAVASVGGVGPVKAPYQLFLEASELTWLMYSLDGAEPLDVMLYPGDKISIQAQRKIFLKLGNAGGVAATLNGKRLPPFGTMGQVKEIRLGE